MADGATITLDTSTLRGDLRDAMLGQIRAMPRTWQASTEDEQREIASVIDSAAGHFIHEAMKLLTDYDAPRAVVKIIEIKISGNDKPLDIKCAAANAEENRNVLGDHVGGYVVMLMTDEETFMGERSAVHIDPDQGELPTDVPPHLKTEEDEPEREEPAETLALPAPETEEPEKKPAKKRGRPKKEKAEAPEEPAPVDPPAEITDEMVAMAKQTAIMAGWVTVSKLQTSLGVDYPTADAVMRKLVDDGVIESEPDESGRRATIFEGPDADPGSELGPDDRDD